MAVISGQEIQRRLFFGMARSFHALYRLSIGPNTATRGLERRFFIDRTGVAAVEFAILAPIFLLLLLGMIAYGIYFGASHSLEQIAADAARTAVAGVSDAERQDIVADFITKSAGGYPLIDAKNLSVEVKDSTVDASQFVVTVRYDATVLPIWGLFENLPMPGRTMIRSSTIRAGGA